MSAMKTQKYRDYLKSPKWWLIRDLVLKRDKRLCQGCLTNEATQVHHLTYRHLFNEFMFELISVCSACHQRLHGPDPQAGEALPYGHRLVAALDRMTDARAKKLAGVNDVEEDAA
jgi:5-methylcytosine-specific restriction endonuclease McrA